MNSVSVLKQFGASWTPFLRSFHLKPISICLLQNSKLLGCYYLLPLNKFCREGLGVDPANYGDALVQHENMRHKVDFTLQTHCVTSRFAKFGLGSGMYLEHA